MGTGGNYKWDLIDRNSSKLLRDSKNKEVSE